METIKSVVSKYWPKTKNKGDLSRDHLQPSLSYKGSYETSFALLVLFDSLHSESKVKQN